MTDRHKIFLEAYSLLDEPGFSELSDSELLQAAKMSLQIKEKKMQEALSEVKNIIKLEQTKFDFMEQ